MTAMHTPRCPARRRKTQPAARAFPYAENCFTCPKNPQPLNGLRWSICRSQAGSAQLPDNIGSFCSLLYYQAD